jgi:cytochrome P450
MAEPSRKVYFNPWDSSFRANPYPHYGAMLDGPPAVINMGPVSVALIARYADVTSVLRDHENFSSEGPQPPSGQYQGRFMGSRSMLGSDPPRHSRLRRLVSRDFTPRRIRELEPRIRQIASGLLDEIAKRGEFDLMADFANVFPVMVIAEMLGVAPELNATFKSWSDALVAAGNNIPGSPQSPEAIKAIDAIGDYFNGEIEKRRSNPGKDLVSALTAAHEGEALSAADLLSFVTLLLVAGNETTTNLIGNGMLALGRHPEQFDLLKQKRDLLPTAIEEMLRFDGPVQSTARFPKQPVQVAGIEIPGGAIVMTIVAAANRDPAKFPDPEKFDIARTPNEHVAFGEGIHFCIGAPLARMEAAIAFEAMLDRFPRMHLKDPAMQAVHKGSYFLRGLESLPMVIE